jgi:hypothetical protein
LLHLPVNWIAAAVGERFSYETDDVATLKVFATILLLPTLCLSVASVVGVQFGFWWALAAVIGLTLNFSASVRIIEAEAGILMSMISIASLAQLGGEIDSLRATRAELIESIRSLVDKYSDPDMPRIFTHRNFDGGAKSTRSDRKFDMRYDGPSCETETVNQPYG